MSLPLTIWALMPRRYHLTQTGGSGPPSSAADFVIGGERKGWRMKTFFERFVDEIVRKRDAGEIDEEKARQWITEIQQRLEEHAEQHPSAPIVQMPVKH